MTGYVPRLRRLLRLHRTSSHGTAEERRLRRDLARAESRLEHALQTRPGDAGRPSFHTEVLRARRLWEADRSVTPRDPGTAFLSKLWTYEFARSHGVAVPRVHAVWSGVREVDWAALPDRTVLKTDGGASSLGVLPLRRDGDGFQVLGEDGACSAAHLAERLSSARRKGRVRYPLFAEQWLVPEGGATDVPDDVKLYTFYGEVGLVLLRRAYVHGSTTEIGFRYVDRAGRDLGRIAPDRPPAPDVPVPGRLDELVATAERLSVAARRPFVRVDLYDTVDGLVLGEITPLPGGLQYYTHGTDERLGAMWEAAELRLATDVRGSGVLDPVLGPGWAP